MPTDLSDEDLVAGGLPFDGAASGDSLLGRLLGDELAGGEMLSDEELAELALGAELDAPLAQDAVALPAPSQLAPALPSWYMPAVALRRSGGTARVVILGIVVVLLVLEALGLCSVFGQVVIG